MSKLNLGQVPRVGIIPKVTNLKVVLKATKVTVGLSKTSGNRMATVELEIIGGATEIVDADGQLTSVLGLKPTMFVILEEDPRSLSTLRLLHERLDLPIDDFDPASDEEVLPMYGKLVFEAWISSKEQKVTEWDGKTGKEVAAKGPDGRDMRGSNQWMPVNADKISGSVTV